MGIRLEKSWRKLDALEVLPGQLGVFQLGDDEGRVLFIGYAGGRSRFGLRSVIRESLSDVPEATCYRLEINTSYLTRYQELLMLHVADHGELPPQNSDGIKLGKLRPI